MRSSIIVASAVVMVAFASSACSFDVDGRPDENVAETSDELLVVLTYGDWSSANSPDSVDMGPDNDRTCFLTAVSGGLHADWKDNPAEISVKQINGRWRLYALRGGGAHVRGKAMCINKVANRGYLGFSHNGFYPTTGGTPHRQCFITRVQGTTGWTYPNSYARIVKAGLAIDSDWQFFGNLPEDQDGSSGGMASAVCVDIPRIAQVDYSFGNPAYELELMDGTSNSVCGFTGISGNFFGTPASEGMEIWPDGTDNTWKLKTSPGKLAHGSCIRGTR